VAGLVAWIIFLVMALISGFGGVSSTEGMMAMALPFAVALGSLFTSFVGVSLCWNPPPVDSLRLWSRASIVAVLITILSGATAFGFHEFGEGEVRFAWFYVLLVAICFGSCSVVFCDSFLRGIDFFFHQATSSNKVIDGGLGISLLVACALIGINGRDDLATCVGFFALYCYFFVRYFLPLRRARLTIVECTK
jgi:hypothetical protein